MRPMLIDLPAPRGAAATKTAATAAEAAGRGSAAPAAGRGAARPGGTACGSRARSNPKQIGDEGEEGAEHTDPQSDSRGVEHEPGQEANDHSSHRRTEHPPECGTQKAADDQRTEQRKVKERLDVV